MTHIWWRTERTACVCEQHGLCSVERTRLWRVLCADIWVYKYMLLLLLIGHHLSHAHTHVHIIRQIPQTRPHRIRAWLRFDAHLTPHYSGLACARALQFPFGTARARVGIQIMRNKCIIINGLMLRILVWQRIQIDTSFAYIHIANNCETMLLETGSPDTWNWVQPPGVTASI